MLKIINEKSIIEINQKRQEDEAKGEAIKSLGKELAQVKFSNIQKDSIISDLGKQVGQAKLDIIKLKGGNQ